ncbi:MAG TPA: LAGLIDADG family homing endonuclease, partial [Anaerolineales bacterium]|nr:LAGLIDADG family homing endonuclease [Anaerolineales bacterium]
MSETLQELLDSLTVEGTLYEKLPDNAVRCYACGHRCLIKEGRQGICKVRFNAGGALRVPWGYVGALQCDPTEKKPFFHIYPGSDTLTFGMLGCDFHCGYCFPPETPIVTDRGVLPIGELFRLGEPAKRTHDAEISFPKALQAVTSSGQFRSIVQVFKHHYMGWMTVIKPYYLPELQCTVDHRVYATDDPEQRPTLIRAEQLTERHYLAIPRQYSFSSPQVVDVPQALAQFSPVFRTPHYKTTSDIVETFSKPAELVIEDGTIRFAKEQRPGIPVAVAVDESFATLLGYYCAEGSVLKDKSRSNSHSLVFAFGLHEADLADEVRRLIKTAFGLTGRITPRRTTLAVSVSKSSLALLFKALCGTRADGKHVPQAIFDAPRPVAQAFLDAYRRGDGHRYANGKLSATTVSRELAYGVAWLSLKLGSLPSLYANRLPARKVIEGRLVKQLPIQYTVVWYEETSVERKYFVTDEFYLIPIRAISSIEYNGDVYNLEVEGEHNYLANFVLVSNCQNWQTSQTLRDNTAGVTPQVVTPQELASMAKRNGAKLVGSSYNEPLIT